MNTAQITAHDESKHQELESKIASCKQPQTTSSLSIILDFCHFIKQNVKQLQR
jgi:hypothetical protein